ncbi:hypothetical protein C0Z19_21900 [Trinickia soli]|uniref:Uncharacterized protein n=2 Tax=Trinickia soli TaxID=380675 RepID=A0A2N7VQ43_9BURK|nr:hypothetical protein C0Z19_21900 [Trinickia soli]
MFPSADPNAPDLNDEPPSTSKNAGGFPTAPPSSAFGKVSIASELREAEAEIGTTGTKADRVIAHLRGKGPTDASAIAELLGIRRDHVSAYLKAALKDGRIVRDGNVFRLGDGKQLAAAEKTAAAPKQSATKDERAPRPPKIAGNDTTVSASLCVGALQIIQWAAGNLTVRANDNVVDLSDTQVLALHAFLELAR